MTPRRGAATTDAPNSASYDTGPREPRRVPLNPAWVALALSVITLFYQIGITSARIAENTRRVELLEAADRQRGDAVGRIDARTARIEATLDIMRGGSQRALSEPLPSSDDPRP